MAAAVTDMARRHTISQILVDLVKFAVGSAIDGSRRIIPGRKQVDKMVPEGLINIPLPTPLKAKKHPDLKVANDLPFETKMEEVKEDMNNLKQQYEASIKRVEESQPPNKSDGGFKEINLVQGNGRRVFIRSRL
ncbi:hypothetical protein AAZX31_12G136600 [Glycine max]|uniref:Uncharacterized protein n=3 Tax=Glycine subgen. Soja TaxID=1462606 RepID=C6T4Y5_SOYBN|nr:uncharacterized protein LOC100527638 [Glycine max]XP_028192191.1 uncharacterized protein LOC114377915 [Glycine soja]ACU16767.1 unknown [Glycine max]KAG4968149.1 hypothetical protein JHK87_033800 [Glycine soja]KAG4980614.1 hypothetical protein JHK85_034572 [Glycine max]KAG4986246.1 hypothetical protein JHK86_033937 [Glycine max]KAG5119436.1 hypothetical protein JHK82_033856 [Glycine max]|eukprot:NP_001235295.1 uncharacterized protein LOC100527638 [Glycine max]